MFKYENDSRKIEKGQTYIAIKGIVGDGHNYIENAIQKGATHIICEKDLDIDIPYTKVDNSSEYQKEILKKEYGNIIDELKLIGVTGTSGKTTSCYLIYQMLLNCGINAAYMGTLGFFHKDYFYELNNTTPDILLVYKLLTEAKERGCEVVVMEVSSQALSYDRIYGIKYDLISYTNLSEDHLDYHKTMEEYLKAKLLILDHLKENAIILSNSDDEFYDRFKKENHKFITYGLNGNYKIENFETLPNETNLTFSYDNNIYDVTIPLVNKYNIYNYLTMLTIVNQLGIELNQIIEKTKLLTPPKGRCEVYKVNNGYAVVDYAHKPDAVTKVIEAYNEVKKNKVITIIGCGGDRDPIKRPIMGEIATRLSDYVIFTDDNPRTEDPNKIMQDVLSGVTKNNYEVIQDRKKAIKKGIDMLEKDDILLILGKGHENYQIIGREKIHLDDAEEVLNWSK